MNPGLNESFVSSLITKTDNNHLVWNKLNTYINVTGNMALHQRLTSEEYYQVLSNESYFVNTKQGCIYLIYAWSKSDINKSSALGYHLYVQEDDFSPLYRIDSDNLYNLADIIKNNENKSSTVINKFIDNFLSNP